MMASQLIKTNGGKILRETSANGAKGILIRSFSGDETRYYFRIYHKSGDFDDYRLRHDDLPVTIDEDALASFYESETGDKFLDHSPEVFGWELVDVKTNGS